jgi:hypothetical protein
MLTALPWAVIDGAAKAFPYTNSLCQADVPLRLTRPQRSY